MKSRYNYTLNDVLDNLYGSSVNPVSFLASDVIKSIMEEEIPVNVAKSLSELGTYTGSPLYTITWATYIPDVLNNVYRLHFDNYCVFTDVELSPKSQQAKLWLLKFLTLVNQTAPRYKNLLTLYKAQETHLLDKLQSTNTGFARFNDTPQGSGDFADDTHATNITNTSSIIESEVKTPMERLKEIQDGYSDLLAKWSEELSVMFLEEGNLDYED